jgi:predicted transcriptional regulator
LLKEYLGFLVGQGLVEERIVGKQRMVYVTTQRGVRVLKCFRELEQALPIVEEARNNRSIPF